MTLIKFALRQSNLKPFGVLHTVLRVSTMKRIEKNVVRLSHVRPHPT